MKTYNLACGCSFELLTDDPLSYEERGMIPPINLNSIPLNCQRVWNLLAKGMTKGVFQLESIGKKWSRILKPQSIEHLSALISLLRPGCLEALDEKGRSMTKVYCDRKNGEPFECLPILKPILEKTYGVICYQEQIIEISRVIGGFNLEQADMLRKSIGKKLTSEMIKCRKMFLEGNKKTKAVSEEEAEKIFSWIEASQRYSFNKSHAMAYALNSYHSAYLKAHFPLQFFLSSLYFSRNNKNEVSELIQEAKRMKISILPPKVSHLKKHFYIDGNSIRFGICDIKGISKKVYLELVQIEKELKEMNLSINDLTWEEFLIFYSTRVGYSNMVSLVKAGGFDEKKNASTAEDFVFSKKISVEESPSFFQTEFFFS
ncbi:MAG: hypothetical protein SNJ64_02200 [Endomicrobiia bacterium]